MVLKTGDLLTGQRTQTINVLRGHLAEHGIVASKAPQHPPRLEKDVAENAERLPVDVARLCHIFFALIDGLSERIYELTMRLRQIARQNDVTRRLMIMPGICPLTAVSIAVLVDGATRFEALADHWYRVCDSSNAKARRRAGWVVVDPRACAQTQNAGGGGMCEDTPA